MQFVFQECTRLGSWDISKRKKQEIFLGQCYQLALFRTNLDCAADESQKEIVKWELSFAMVDA